MERPINESPSRILPQSSDYRLDKDSREAPQAASAAWRGLIWCEWFAQSKLILGFIALWLVTVWILPLFAHPGWILLLGILFALSAGPAYGGGDIIEGTEEFNFALPISRKRRYLARLCVGGGALMALTCMDLLVLGLDLPQTMAGFFVSTGLLEGKPVMEPKLLYGLVMALPFAQFSLSFSISANSHSRAMVLASGFWGLVISMVLLQAGLAYEEWFWGETTGFITYPLLMIAGGGSLTLGYFLYQEKEISPSLTPLSLPPRTWLWMGLFALGLGALGYLVPSFVRLWRSWLF